MRPKIKPPVLRKGDTVGVVSPSGKPDLIELNKGIEVFRNLGFEVVLVGVAKKTGKWGYLAGRDSERAECVNEAFRNDGINGIICSTGGYGAQRILPHIDYDVIKDNPKILMGYSDITALHLGIPKKTGLITFHGPTLGGIGGEFTDYTKEQMLKALTSTDPIGEVVNPSDGPCIQIINEGKASGELVGGNGSLVSTTLGTPYETETEGKILIFENVNRRPWEIDRMLTQLKLSGKLDALAGIVVGESVGCDPSEESPFNAPTKSLEEVLQDSIGEMDIPAIYGLCCGHGKNKATLPIGAKATLDATNRKLIIEEPATTPR